jgi:predicted aspartyl protease
MKLRTEIAVILFMVADVLAANSVQAANSGCEISKYGELPVTMLEGRAFVSATINGEDAKFIVDSGAFFSSLTRGSADKFKLRLRSLPGQMQIQGIGGTAVAELTTVKAFSLPGLHGAPLKDVDFVVLGNRISAEADGLLGENVLGFADTEYDLANSAIRLMRAKGCDKSVLAYWRGDSDFAVVEVAPRTAMEPHIIGSASLNGTKLKVMFDSGVAQSTLTLKAAARAGIKPSSDGVTPGGTYFGVGRNAVESWIAHFQSLNLGGEEIRNIGLRFADFSLSTDADMLIGLDFFKSHRIYVSKSQRRLYFTYNGGQVFDLSVLHVAERAEGATGRSTESPAAGQPENAAATISAHPGDA